MGDTHGRMNNTGFELLRKAYGQNNATAALQAAHKALMTYKKPDCGKVDNEQLNSEPSGSYLVKKENAQLSGPISKGCKVTFKNGGSVKGDVNGEVVFDRGPGTIKGDVYGTVTFGQEADGDEPSLSVSWEHTITGDIHEGNHVTFYSGPGKIAGKLVGGSQSTQVKFFHGGSIDAQEGDTTAQTGSNCEVVFLGTGGYVYGKPVHRIDHEH
jgi:hypothetical protein